MAATGLASPGERRRCAETACFASRVDRRGHVAGRRLDDAAPGPVRRSSSTRRDGLFLDGGHHSSSQADLRDDLGPSVPLCTPHDESSGPS